MNRLKDSDSPYLRQHATNKVDWYEWGPEAFKKAQEEDKPIFLSIGYSTCHWCHVMAHESFEDSMVAAMMNGTFVCIKVDREQRPDIDKVYMRVCQMLTGQGGWPLTIIMTPDKKPFFAGTYFPKNGRQGLIGMTELVPRIKDIWQMRRENIEMDAEKAVGALREAAVPESSGKELGEEVMTQAYQILAQQFDTTYAGFGEAPKFPTPHNLTFLLRWWKRNDDKLALEMVTRMLRAMRLGGVYDQVGYGFHRYSTDRQWHVPHFEKMLYDQATISMAYLEAWQATGEELFTRTAREIFTYVQRDLASPEGAFYSAEDADSEGEEGKFYVWSWEELKKILSSEQLELAAKVWGLAQGGNFREESSGQVTGTNILHMRGSYAELAGDFEIDEQELRDRMEAIRGILFKERLERVRPGRDDKILADWNGLMAASLARGAVLLGDSSYAEAAGKALEFVLDRMTTHDGRLYHCFAGGEPSVSGTLDDYAFVVWALLELYEADFDESHLETAVRLNEQMMEHFASDGGGFFFSSDEAEELPARQMELYDGALPSGNSVAALNLLKLARITGDETLAYQSDRIGEAFSDQIHQAPPAFTQYLSALDYSIGPSREVVVVNGGGDSGLEMARSLQWPYVPNKVLLLKRGGELDKLAPFTEPLASVDGGATAYVCVNYACELPTTDGERALELLTR